jgi:hypothetical protein
VRTYACCISWRACETLTQKNTLGLVLATQQSRAPVQATLPTLPNAHNVSPGARSPQTPASPLRLTW